jgi:uncharacterized protein
MKSLSLASHGRKLSARLYQPVQPSGKAVLVLHGYYGNQASHQRNAEALCNLGFTCLTVDLSGHGDSEGVLDDLSINDHLQDVLTAYDCLAAQDGVRTDSIAAFGSSYGAFLSVLLGAERAVSNLLLRVPALYQDTLFDFPHKEWDRPGLEQFRRNVVPTTLSRTLRALHDFAGSVLIVESEHDEQVPHSIIAAYAGNIQHGSVVVMPGAKHSLQDAASQQTFLQILTVWGKSL